MCIPVKTNIVLNISILTIRNSLIVANESFFSLEIRFITIIVDKHDSLKCQKIIKNFWFFSILQEKFAIN